MSVSDRKMREKQERRDVILEAARQLFLQDGFASVSMRKIASEIEYSPMSLYQYFGGKDEILEALCRRTFDGLSQSLRAIPSGAGTPLDRLRAGLNIYVRFGLEHPRDYELTFLTRRTAAAKPDGDPPIGMEAFAILRQHVAAAIESGVLAVQEEEAAQTLWAGVHGITALLIVLPEFPFVEREKLIRRVIDTLLTGMQPRIIGMS